MFLLMALAAKQLTLCHFGIKSRLTKRGCAGDTVEFGCWIDVIEFQLVSISTIYALAA
jgi:hypothetical protein